MDKIYRHPLKVSNKKIGSPLHTSLHNFATQSKLLRINDRYGSSRQRYGRLAQKLTISPTDRLHINKLRTRIPVTPRHLLAARRGYIKSPDRETSAMIGGKKVPSLQAQLCVTGSEETNSHCGQTTLRHAARWFVPVTQQVSVEYRNVWSRRRYECAVMAPLRIFDWNKHFPLRLVPLPSRHSSKWSPRLRRCRYISSGPPLSC